jgi:hypothetical protein
MAQRHTADGWLQLSVHFGWYEAAREKSESPEDAQTRRRDERTRACTGALGAIALDLLLSRIGLLDALRKRDLDDCAQSCRFYAESCITRTYYARERVWELMNLKAGHVGMKFRRKNLPELLERVQRNQPDLADCCRRFYQEIHSDVEIRNAATHQHFVFLTVFIGKHFFGEIGDILQDIDPDSKDGPKVKRAVRAALKAFVQERAEHTQTVADLVFRLSELFS